jgi:hypothetical protein
MAPARIPVTPANVQAFVLGNLSEANYAQFYGLHLLTDAQFSQVWDALLNGDCQVEELVRLGAFTGAEVSAFITDVLGDWASPGVAAPYVGTSGYAYLTETLGLTAALQADAAGAVTVPGPNQQAFLGVRLYAGAPGDSYASVAAIDQLFEEEVLPGALGGLAYNAVLPQTQGDVAEYVCPAGGDAEASAMAAAWYNGIFAPLFGVPQSRAGDRLLCVNEDPSLPLLANPGLAQWLISEPELPQAFRLLLLREAAVRSAQGPYSKPQVAAAIASVRASAPGPVATSRSMAGIYLWAQILPAACAESLTSLPGDADWLAYQAQAAEIAAAYAAIQSYRLRVRGFLLAVYNGALANLQGTYPPAG